MDSENQDQSATNQLTYTNQSNFIAILFFHLKRNKGWAIGLGVFVLFLIFGAGGFAILNNSKQQINPLPVVVPSTAPVQKTQPQTQVAASISAALNSPNPVSSSSAAPTPTPIWTSYMSVQNYSIGFPGDWNVVVIKNSDPRIIEFAVFNPVSLGRNNYSITISYSNRSYAEALAKEPAGNAATVSGILGIQTQVQNSDNGISYHYIIPIGTGSSTLVFVAKEAYKSILDQMLTTFKFTR